MYAVTVLPPVLLAPRRRLTQFCLISASLLLAAPSLHALEIQAFTENLPPLNYEENGVAKGFSVDLLRAIGKEAGVTINIRVMPWPRAYQMAQSTPNSIIFAMVRSAEREDLFTWLGPIAKRKIYFYKLSARKDIILPNLEAAKKYRIGAVRDSASTKLLIDQDFQAGKEIDLAKDAFINMRKLLAGHVELIITLDWAANFTVQQVGGKPEQITPVLLFDQAHDYYFGLNKDADPASVKKLQAAFEKIKKNGTLKQLQLQYLGSNNQ